MSVRHPSAVRKSAHGPVTPTIHRAPSVGTQHTSRSDDPKRCAYLWPPLNTPPQSPRHFHHSISLQLGNVDGPYSVDLRIAMEMGVLLAFLQVVCFGSSYAMNGRKYPSCAYKQTEKPGKGSCSSLHLEDVRVPRRRAASLSDYPGCRLVRSSSLADLVRGEAYPLMQVWSNTTL